MEMFPSGLGGVDEENAPVPVNIMFVAKSSSAVFLSHKYVPVLRTCPALLVSRQVKIPKELLQINFKDSKNVQKKTGSSMLFANVVMATL